MNMLNIKKNLSMAVQQSFLFMFSLWLTTTSPTSYASEKSLSMSEYNVYIIHGFMATPDDHWFQWLKDKLEERGIAVNILALPDSFSPDPMIWQKTLEENIDRLNEKTFLVAHSLGCVSLLSYLDDREEDKPIGGLILVSGFVAPLPELPQLNSFVDHQVNFEKIIKVAPQRAVVGSPQDPIVPYSLTEALASDLSADLYSIDGAGHFLAEDGYDSFPQLLDTLLKMTSK
ncbi:RBBP9/YdeN family alpha/beta hydrolase [Halomonas organivorans]|uniref:Serine hydrolase family protein n=1 Tax=Halomonas organivorans TaxID=257772 RepID=A0A7W5G3X3_9GAMM|nr:alpha/beta hydrolase [Halomonas organivorans]MBB3139340.1 hypothetical protein [Halomonas organivorans]